MSSIRSVRDTFQTLISEVSAARRDRDSQVNHANMVRQAGRQEAEHILLAVYRAHPDPSTWPDGSMKTKAQVSLIETATQRDAIKANLDRLTPKDLASDRHEAKRLAAECETAAAKARESQVTLTQTLEGLPLEMRLRWGDKLLRPDRADLIELMSPPPTGWQRVVATLRSSPEQLAMWSVMREHDARHGAGSLARAVQNLGDLEAQGAAAEGQRKAALPKRDQLNKALEAYDEAQDRWARTPDLAQSQASAVKSVITAQAESDAVAWLKALAPDQVKAYTFARAKQAAPDRVVQALQGQIKALEKLERKLDEPMSKLNKGVRAAPGKYISVDDDKIARDVRKAIKDMKPLSASAGAALKAVSNLAVEPQSVSQARFYQKSQTVPASESHSWLLMWLLLEGQYSPAGVLLATDNPALALGMAAVLPSWNQGSWDAINTLPATVPDVTPAAGQDFDFSVPAPATSVPDSSGWIPEIPQSDLAVPLPSFSGSDISLPQIDVPLPSMDLNMPSIDISMPSVDFSLPPIDVSMPSVDFSMPSVDFSMPSIDVSMPSIDTSSFSSGFDSSSW